MNPPLSPAGLSAGDRVAFTADAPLYGVGVRTGTVVATDRTWRQQVRHLRRRFGSEADALVGIVPPEFADVCFPVVRLDPCPPVPAGLELCCAPWTLRVIDGALPALVS